MKHILLILTILALAASICALPVSSLTAGETALQWLQQTQPTDHSAVSIADVSRLESSGSAGIYLVALKPVGFVLVSSDDRVKPILGFSFNSTFAAGQSPESVKWFMASYQETISRIIADPSLTPHPEWEQIRRLTLPQVRTERDVIPLLTTTWNQSWPYNELCPADATLPDGHVKAGCWATAVSQVIKYWSYPIHGVGSNSYNLAPWGQISANFEEATYNYNSMPNNLTNTPDTDISRLLFHAGVAMEMQYSNTGSTALPADARAGLVDHFSYSDSAILRSFTQTGENNWIDFLVSDLTLSRPILQYGTESAGDTENAWVVDGVINTSYFHVNWGWGGTFNGFYYMNNLRPGQFWFNTNIGGIFEVRPFALVPAPLNLTAVVQNFDNVYLQWQPVTEIVPTGYLIYRNGVLLTTLDSPNAQFYLDETLTPGTYTYYVKTQSLYGISEPSNSITLVVFSAPVLNYTDSFEGMVDYTAMAFPWQSLDLDLSPTTVVPGYDYPNEGAAGSFFTMRPLYMIPPNWDITMHQGFKCAASFGAVNGANNDWMITPIWNTGNTAQIRFWAKSDVGTHQPSLLKVGYSTDPVHPTQMTVLSGPNPIVLPNVWTEYVYNIAGHFNQNVVVCFQNVSVNGYLLLIDDLTLNTGTAVEDESQTPAASMLSVYPNPARAAVNVSFKALQTAPVSLNIYDIKGRLIKTMSAQATAGAAQNLVWDRTGEDGVSVASGMYLLKVTSAGRSLSRKVVILSN